MTTREAATQSAPGAFDAVQLEVLWSRLVSIVEEAETTLVRMSYSSTVGEADDHGAALLDARGQILAQTPSGMPAFIAILGRTTRTMLRHFPPETLRRGDVLITNDPWICAGHLPDINLLQPIFHRGRLIAFAANTAHLSDVGGRGSAEAVDLFEEGLRIPPSKLYRAGRPNDDLLNIIRANSRTPKQIMGDLHAQLAANASAERRVVEMMDEYGLADLDALSDAIQTRTERAMREIIGRLPDGVYRGEIMADGYDNDLRIAVAVTIRGTDIIVDYTGTSPQIDRGINCPFNLTYAETMFPFRCIAPHIPMAEGALRPIEVTAPDGCIVNPRFPAPVLRRTVVIHNAHAAIFQALAPLAPDHIGPHTVAAHSGCIFGFRFRGEWTGKARAYRHGLPLIDGRFFQAYLFMGGQGATLAADGHSALTMPDNCANVPIEVMETRAPLLFENKALLADSGGAGQHRGGLGQRVTVRVLADHPVLFVPSSVGRIRHPAPGIAGGGVGGAARIFDADTGADFHPRLTVPVAPGTRISIDAPGGGGAGDPRLRDPHAIAEDLRLGYITGEGVRHQYSAGPSDAGG
jgi:N-methylhydantoinase B